MFTLCKPISSKKRFSPNRKINEDFTFTLFENSALVNKTDWNSVVENRSHFLNINYLSVIERCEKTKLLARYVIVYLKGKPCGIIYFQVIDFEAGIFGDLLGGQIDNIRSKRLKLFENYIGANKNEVLMRLFTCGNNVASGEHGYLFKESIVQEQVNELMLEITSIVSKEEKLRGTISAVLLKDFETKLKPEELFEEEKYTNFLVEPNMVLDIPSGVNSKEDYIQLFSKKYRNRAKSIFKAGAGIEKRNLTIEEIKEHEAEIYRLYESVYDKAKFKLLKLPLNYFSSVKEMFAEEFFVCGFFLEGKLIAFSSCFLINKFCLEAHYIGFDYNLNNEYELYQNILYHNISEAIIFKRNRVNLGRTAAEIKTTVGAKPVDLICYVKPQNTISKLIMKPFIGFLQPAQWTPRNPFKEETLQDGSEQQKQPA